MRGATPFRPAERGFASGLFALVSLFLVTVGVMAWIAMGIVTSERWPIRWLELNGAFQRVSAEQLRASLDSQVGSSFFTVDLQGLHQAASRISWVSSVEVQKQWPDTIRVTVEEFAPVAHWNEGRLIAADGSTFEVPEADEIQGLPWLEGPEERLAEVLDAWVGFNELLLAQGLEIAQLKLDGRGSWSMVLDSGTQVQLGRDAAVERLERLLVSWRPLMREQEAPPLGVDLRYTNGFAVLWAQNAGPQAALAANQVSRERK